MIHTELKKEVQSLTDFFAETDVKIHGEITEQTKTIATVQDCYIISTPTSYRRGLDGWEGNTDIDCNGYTWHIHTAKGSRGISTWITTIEKHGNNGSMSMGFITGKQSNQDFKIPFQTIISKVTENYIRQAHEEAINTFKAKHRAGELAIAPKGIEVGQILFTHGNGGRNERAVYQIDKTDFGTNYKCVLLDGSGTKIDSHVRPYAELFGIGVYYNEGDTVTQDEINRLLPLCREADEKAVALRQEERNKQEEAAAKRKEYLSQFKRADTRQRSQLVKTYVLNTYPTVSKVEVKSDSFSGGDSIDITYHSPERIKELDSWINSFAYGHFDGMTDMYENNKEPHDIIVEGYILTKSKYASAYHVFAELQERKPQPEVSSQPATSTNGVIVTLVSAKGGIEVKFETKQLAEKNSHVIDRLKQLGFKWSRFNSTWWANQSTSRAEYARSLMGDNAASEENHADDISGYINAQEEAYCDNRYQG